MSGIWWIGLSLVTLTMPQAAQEIEEGARTLWAGRLTPKHSAREVRWDGAQLEIGVPDGEALWRAAEVEQVGAAGACQQEAGWYAVATRGPQGWEARRLVEREGAWLETRWRLSAQPVSGWSHHERRGGCWMGVLLADGTLALVGPGAEQAELLRDAVAPVIAPEELGRGLFNTRVGRWAVYGGPDGVMHANEIDGAARLRVETGSLALPEAVIEGDERVWWMTRSGALWSWAPAQEAAPREEWAGGVAMWAGPVAWPGVGMVWGDLRGQIWRWDGERAQRVMQQRAALTWAPLVFDAFDEDRMAALFVADDGAGLLLHAEQGQIEGVRLELGARSAYAPRVVPRDTIDALPWLSLAQGDGAARRVRFVRSLSARLERPEVRLGEEATHMVAAVNPVSQDETPATAPTAPELPGERVVETSGQQAYAVEGCAAGGAAGAPGWSGMALALGMVCLRRTRRRVSIKGAATREE